MFNLDPRLENDTYHVTDLPLCRVLLMNDAQFPWLILVPRKPELIELYDLDDSDMQQYVQESRLCCRVLSRVFTPHKLNVAALGNIVRQLHIHHVARFESDVAWPGPIWGQQPAVPYAQEQIASLLETLQRSFSMEEIQ